MPQTDTATSFPTLYAFGDSLSDAGNLSISTGAIGDTTPVSPPYGQETYGSTTANVFSNGPTWVQDVSLALGLGTLAPSLLGGGDFAYGGAETGLTPQNTNLGEADLQLISLPSQLTQFQADVPNPTAGALYTLSIGSNDVLDILSDTSLSASQQSTDITDSVDNEISFVKQLAAGGATNLAVLDIPDLGKTPDVESGLADGSDAPSATFDALASQLASQYNGLLATQLAIVASADNLNVTLVDAYGLIDNAVANPGAYGLTNVTSPVWSGNYTSASSGTLASTSTATQDQYLFWDHLHPTETGHQAVASQAESDIAAAPPGSANIAVEDASTNQALAAHTLQYLGPVAGITDQYLDLTTDNLNISTSAGAWFIHTGGGEDAISVAGGGNVVDGGTGSNFLTSTVPPPLREVSNNTFFIDDRNAASSIWSTVGNFVEGDAVTVWGLTQSASLQWVDGQGATGYTGLTLHANQSGQPTASLTLVGYSQADLTNGNLTVSFGNSAGSNYMYIHTNGFS